jgi:hypothetical protein
MKYTGKILTLFFAMFLLIGATAVTASAQRRGGRIVRRPVIVRHYYVQPNPFWYWNTWRSPYYYDPYISISRQRYDLERELRGNKEELSKHLEKYNADGVVTAKEREELKDDYRDVARAQRQLNEFNRRY